MPRRSQAQKQLVRAQNAERNTGQLIQERPFPQPVRFAFRTTRWRLSEIEVFEKGRTNRTSEDERWLRDAELAERFGVSKVAIWDWAKKARRARHDS